MRTEVESQPTKCSGSQENDTPDVASSPAIYNKNFVISRANTAKSKQWNRQELDYAQFVDLFSNHREDTRKDGPAFVPGEIMGGERKATAVNTLYCIVFDIDSGQTYDEVRSTLNKFAYEAIMFTTYSHMKTVSHIKTDNFARWAAKHNLEPSAGKPLHTQENIDRYVDEELGEEGRAKLGGKFFVRERLDHTPDGMQIAVDHPPIEKFRVVIPFEQPFIFSSHGYTSAEQVQNWKRWYHGIAKHLGLRFDKSCADPPRLYYFPSHPPGDENFRLDHLLSDPENPDAIKRTMLDFHKIQQVEVEVGPEGKKQTATGGTPSSATTTDSAIGKWLRSYRGTFKLATLLAPTEHVTGPTETEGKFAAACPFGERHSDGKEGGAFVVDPVDGSPFTFHCMHAGCKHKTPNGKTDQAPFLDKMLELGWITRADLENRELGGGPLEQSKEVVAGLHDRVRLRSLLGAELVADPFDKGRTLRVRDAQIIGHAPVVEYENGEPVDDIARYVDALTSGHETAAHIISDDDVRALALDLSTVNWPKTNLSPAQLKTPNVALFEAALPEKPSKVFASRNKDWLETVGDYSTFRTGLLRTLHFNIEHALLRKKGHVVAIDNDKSTLSLDAFNKYHANEWTYYEGEQCSYSTIWMKHPARATYGGVYFAPMGYTHGGVPVAENGLVNFWIPPVVKPEAGDWSLLRTHIRDVICSGVAEHFEYLMSWVAHMFQKPWDKPGVAIVTWSPEQGTGKGTVTSLISEGLGDHLAQTIGTPDHFIGKHAGGDLPLLFYVLEEAVFSKDPRVKAILKHRIADTKTVVELKYFQPVAVDDFARVWINSNDVGCVPVEPGDRRYFILRVSDKHKQDTRYFKAILDQMRHNGGLAAMVHELLARNISDFDPRVRPVTVAHKAMVLEQLDKKDRAIVEMVAEGRLYARGKGALHEDIDKPLAEDQPTWVCKDDVQAALNDAFKRYGAGTAEKRDIYKHLRKLGVVDDDRNTDVRRGVIAAYRFVPMAEARAALIKALDLPADAFDRPTQGHKEAFAYTNKLCPSVRQEVEGASAPWSLALH